MHLSKLSPSPVPGRKGLLTKTLTNVEKTDFNLHNKSYQLFTMLFTMLSLVAGHLFITCFPNQKLPNPFPLILLKMYINPNSNHPFELLSLRTPGYNGDAHANTLVCFFSW